MTKNKSEKSKTIISFVMIRAITTIATLILSIIIAINIYKFAVDINMFIAIFASIIIILFFMTVINKTLIELVLKLLKK